MPREPSVLRKNSAICPMPGRTVAAISAVFIALSCLVLLGPLPYFSWSNELPTTQTIVTETVPVELQQHTWVRTVRQHPQRRRRATPGIPVTFKGGKFFIYNGSEFDFSKTLECYRRYHKGKNIWENEIRDTVQDTGELWLHRSLVEHPNRTFDPEEADLFFVPTYIATSFRMNTQCGSTHYKRMMNVTAALKESPYWQRHGGADHLFVCGWWKCKDALRVLRNDLRANRTSLLTTMERYKEWSDWKCPERLVAHPYVANNEITREFSNTPFSDRSTTFLFVGCSRYKAARKNIEVLNTFNGSFIRVATTCTFSVPVARYGERIKDAQFCLVPRGDTFTSRRLFDAVAAGCIPIIQNGGIQKSLPFRWKLDYHKFAFFVPKDVFEDPTLLLDYCTKLVNRPVEQLERMHRTLLSIRNDLVWGQGSPFGLDAQIGNVGDNILFEAMYKASRLRLREKTLTSERCRGDWPDPKLHIVGTRARKVIESASSVDNETRR